MVKNVANYTELREIERVAFKAIRECYDIIKAEMKSRNMKVPDLARIGNTDIRSTYVTLKRMKDGDPRVRLSRLARVLYACYEMEYSMDFMDTPNSYRITIDLDVENGGRQFLHNLVDMRKKHYPIAKEIGVRLGYKRGCEVILRREDMWLNNPLTSEFIQYVEYCCLLGINELVIEERDVVKSLLADRKRSEQARMNQQLIRSHYQSRYLDKF